LWLEVVGLDGWEDRLDELCDAVANELEIVQNILETSERTRQTSRKKRVVRPFSFLLMGFLFEP
jgi:hypothetical protein